MAARWGRYSNATLLNDDVMAFEPSDRYSMIFLGGMLMYLNESDVIKLLEERLVRIRRVFQLKICFGLVNVLLSPL